VKAWAASLINHMLGRTTSLVSCYRIMRTDTQTFGLTEGTRNIEIEGVTYYASGGLQTTVVQKSDTLAVDIIDVTAFLDESGESEIEAGLWDGAIITIFEVNYMDIPSTFVGSRLNIIREGILGRVERQDQRFTAEIRSKMTRFDTHMGAQYTILCPWTLGDAVCGVDLTPFTYTGTVTSVSGNARLGFTANGLAQRPGYFSQGRVTFTSGDNAGYSMDVRHYNNKHFSLNRPMPYNITDGDTFTAVRGDDHTFKTCRDVFHNIQRFRGFHFLPGIDKLLENPVHWSQRPVPVAPPDGNPDNMPGDGVGGGTDDSGGGEGE
jgi:uncharacterized phage protein (TIGR02218 family)